MFGCVFGCVFINFSVTTGPRILKFGTNIEYDLVLCKRESGLLMVLARGIHGPLVTLVR